jgi:hypothetical protein
MPDHRHRILESEFEFEMTEAEPFKKIRGSLRVLICEFNGRQCLRSFLAAPGHSGPHCLDILSDRHLRLILHSYALSLSRGKSDVILLPRSTGIS